MPRVTPSQTNHGRNDAAFRGGSQRGGELKALVRANRRKKRKLINEARAAGTSADLIEAGNKLVALKRRWALVGSGGREFDARLAREFDEAYASFGARWKAEHGKTKAATAGVSTRSRGPANSPLAATQTQIGPAKPSAFQAYDARVDGGATRSTDEPYAALGTGCPRGGASAVDIYDARVRGGAIRTTQRAYAALGTGDASGHPRPSSFTEPSQATPTVASQPGNTVGGGTAGQHDAPSAPSPSTTKTTTETKTNRSVRSAERASTPKKTKES
jgi:hypothetical protein